MKLSGWIRVYLGVLVGCTSPAADEPGPVADEQGPARPDEVTGPGHGVDAHGDEAHDEHDVHGRGEEAHGHAGHGAQDGHGGHDAHATGIPEELVLDEDALRDLRITTAVAQTRPEQISVSALGELRVDETRYAEVGAAVPGRVVRLLAAEGDTVKAGQALAELESPEVGRARAALVQATARLELATRAVERKKGLLEGGSVSPRELEEAETELTTAAAEVRAAQATLEPMRVGEKGEGGRFPLVSPVPGQVLSRQLHLGELLMPERAAFRVADLARLWVVAPVFERDAMRLSPGTPVHILPAALPGQRLDARLTRIGAEVQPESRTVGVRIDLDNPERRLKPGMSATVQFFSAGASAVVTVPLAAVQRLEDHWVVFVPTETGRFQVRVIGRGRDLGGEIEVLSGLQAGTSIVVDGSFVLRAAASQSDGEDAHHH